jgi:hypothetical protein
MSMNIVVVNGTVMHSHSDRIYVGTTLEQITHDYMLWLTSHASYQLYKIYLFISTQRVLQNFRTPHQINGTCEQLSARISTYY